MMALKSKTCYWVATAAILTLLAAAALWVHDSRKIHECLTELHTSKRYPDGRVMELNLTTVLIFQRSTILDAIYKGRLTTPDGTYTLDRAYRLQLRSVNESNIYQRVGRQLRKAPDDNAPTDIVNQLQLDNTDFFYITHLNNNAWLVHTLIFPSMVCKGR